MQQRSIIAHFSLKGLSAPEINNDPEITLEPDAVSYRSVRCYLREAQFPQSSADPTSIEDPQGLDDSDQSILSAPEDGPFAAVRQLSRPTALPSTTVYCRPGNCLDSMLVTFNECHMFCQTRKTANELICPGNCSECLKSNAIEHGFT
jgi:hypothetical protein